MLIHQRKWKKTFSPSYTLRNTESFCSSQPNSSSSSNRESDVSLWLHGDAKQLERAAFENPSSLTAATTQPCNNAFKTHMCITHISWSYFFPHFGHHNIAIKSFLGLSAWFRVQHVWRKCVRWGAFLNSRCSPAPNLFCSPVWREEEPGAAFKQAHLRSLLLPEWRRRGWDQLMAGIRKDWLPFFFWTFAHLCQTSLIWSLELKPQNR